MNLLKYLKLTCTYLIYMIGAILGFGFLIGQIEYLNTKLIYSTFGQGGIILTGFIGTIVHELSHLAMCVIFNHKIMDVELFRPLSGQIDGVLGYVIHTYNPQNIYQLIGNFFIGIAPLIGGILVIKLLLRLLLPDIYANFNLLNNIGNFDSEEKVGQRFILFKKSVLNLFYLMKELILTKNIFTIKYLVFIFFMYSILTHMGLSYADLKGAFSGLISIFLVTFILIVITSLLGVKKTILSKFFLKYNIYIVSFFIIGIVFSLLTIIISYMCSIII